MDSTRPGLLARIETYLASHPWASVRVIAEELPRPIRAPLDPAGVSSLLLCLKRRKRVESRRQFEEGMPVLGYRLTAAACPVTAELRQVQDSIHPDVPARDVLLADVRRRREERRALIEQYAQPTPPSQLSPFDQLLEDCR
ncbi:hypothetical protein BOO71_0000526 [Deinococcus marmoris]|uniref:Uncharacterized protein n=2 Tax=Deinococcus marmoris TaxID=249408 RepID=A0A1U7P4T2_9DEIO|nr:hypothetical protein BOO71_0000526 [Deinococcus marmoris]